MSARLAELHRERARLGRELAGIDEAIAVEMAGPAEGSAPTPPKSRARQRPMVVVASESVTDIGRARARRVLRRAGVALADEGSGER